MSFEDLHEKPVVRIRNWFILGNRLHGQVYGHPGNVNGQFPDGTDVVTSAIVKQNLSQNVIETRNTLYHLEGQSLSVAPVARIRVYVSGPITGKPNLNKLAFDCEAERLVASGFDVFNPQTIPAPPKLPKLDATELWQYYMNECVKEIPLCQEMRMLPDWQNSIGAVWEHRIAKMLGKHITYCHVPDPDAIGTFS